jgi:HSP20 family protein
MNDLNRIFNTMDLFSSGLGRMGTRGGLFPSSIGRILSDYDRLLGFETNGDTIVGSPRMNLYDNGENFQVVAEIPGFSKDELDIKSQGNYLELSGTRKADTPVGYKARRVERGVTSFTRSFTLPADVDADHITATLKDGLLTMVLPKTEKSKPKQITIR